MYSFVIKIAILVNRAVKEVNTIPMLGLTNDMVDVEIEDPDATKVSVIINNAFFLFKFLYLFLYYSLSVLNDFYIFS